MPINSSDSILTEIITDACLRLFDDYRVVLTPCAPADVGRGGELLLCGVIGFTGDQLRGTLMLATTAEPLGDSSPVGPSQLRAWIAELANQLLGRIKNRLSAHGASIYLSTPVVLQGQHLAPMPRTNLLPLAFAGSSGGHVCVWVETEHEDGFVLAPAAAHDPGAIAEGELMMF